VDTPTRTNGDAYEDMGPESVEELYETAPCGYISTLPDGTIVKVNQTFLDWVGYHREELLGRKRFQELLTVGGKIFHETHYAPLLRMQGFIREINFDLAPREGPALPVLVSTVQKRDAAGKLLLNRTTLFNISDRKNYERELLLARKKAEQAVKAKADFLSMVSHEIRTPMNAIIGLSNLLQQSELSPQQEKYVSILHASSENLLNLLNNILDFSKIEAGKLTLEERSFDIRQLISSIVYGLNVKAEQKGLTIRLEIDERVPACLVGDPVKLGQVLTNLLSNSIKFTETGSVTLSLKVRELSAESTSIDFRVTDTGIGIAPDRLSHVFEEFTQASYDIGMKYGGTGLGLAICQRLVEMCGSRINVESSLGAGSSFSFNLRLKLDPRAEASRQRAEPPLGAQRLDGLRVLVAEDNPVNVFVLSQFLRKWGIEFDVVENGHRAVAQVQEKDYGLVLMDLQMPGLDGYSATRAIRQLADERLQQLPVIALTASARGNLLEQLGAEGFTDFVGKPFKPEELLAKITLHARPPLSSPAPAPTNAPPAPEPTVAAPEQAPAGETPAKAPRFNLQKFWSLAEGDREAVLEMSTITIMSSEQFKQDFQRALESGNRDEFEFHAHKIKTTVELLDSHGLRTALQHGMKILSEERSDSARIHATIHTIHQELDAIIGALKEEVRKV
jgi:PAS domain S-box-containing protein